MDKRGNSRRKQIRRRRRRRKRILTTIFLLFLLIFIGVGVGYLIYSLKGGTFDSFVQTYSAEKEFANTLTSKENLKADTFAKDLCIIEQDVQEYDSVVLEEGQEAVLLDLNNKSVLYSKNALQRVYPASITKIMTAILVLKYGNMNDSVVITAEDLNLEEGAQVCGFWEGDRVTVDQLLHCLLVYSGNDAASALSSYIGGDIPSFVNMMNSYAASLGCTGTHFTNPHGLHDENHYTTPYDIYLMLNEALKYPEFTEITQMPSYTLTYTHSDGSQTTTVLQATDHYLTGEATAPKNVTVLGGKTGTTSDAGNCLALLSQNAFGQPYVSIVMGSSTKEVLYEQMSSLLQHINDN